MGYQLGVDLGTTYTAAAVRRGDVVTMLGLGNRAMQVPSVLYLQVDGDWLVGEAAEARAAAMPERIAREFKRRIGDPVPIIVGGAPVSAELLTARLLSWVVSVAVEREGGAPDAIIVSYPANWSHYKTDLLRQAFALAELPDVATCTEPEAAAITYASRQRVPDGAYVAVYDLGGGTFDAAVLRRAGDGFSLVGRPEGIEHLGGVDFDEAVFQHVVRSLGRELADLDPDDPAVVRGLERLRRDCVAAKESLSTDTEALVSVAIGARDTVVRLTRGEFEDMVRPALAETVSATGRVSRSADVEPAELTAILLVGGSSRIPLVSEVLSAAFGRPLALDAHPKHEVAMGAAWLSGPLPEAAVERGPGADSSAGGLAAATTDVLTREGRGGPDRAPPTAGGWLKGRRAWMAGAGVALVAAVAATVLVTSGAGSGGAAGNNSPPSTAEQSIPSASLSKSVVDIGAQRPKGPTALGDDVILWTATRGAEQQIWSVPSDGRGSRALVRTGDDFQQSISHDRKTIAYVQQTGNPPNAVTGVRLVGSNGVGDRPLFTTAPKQCPAALRPAFSPDDTLLAVPCQVSLSDPRSWAIYVVDMSGRIVGPARATGYIGDPTFNRTGTRIGYWESRASDNDTRIDEVNVVGAPRPVPRSAWTQGINDPTFSPVDDTIMVRIGTCFQGTCDLYLLKPGTTRPTVVARTPGVSEQDPSWSPDGTQIAYKRGPNDNADIWVMDANGKNQRPLVASSGPDSTPAWAAR